MLKFPIIEQKYGKNFHINYQKKLSLNFQSFKPELNMPEKFPKHPKKCLKIFTKTSLDKNKNQQKKCKNNILNNKQYQSFLSLCTREKNRHLIRLKFNIYAFSKMQKISVFCSSSLHFPDRDSLFMETIAPFDFIDFFYFHWMYFCLWIVLFI